MQTHPREPPSLTCPLLCLYPCLCFCLCLCPTFIPGWTHLWPHHPQCEVRVSRIWHSKSCRYPEVSFTAQTCALSPPVFSPARRFLHFLGFPSTRSCISSKNPHTMFHPLMHSLKKHRVLRGSRKASCGEILSHLGHCSSILTCLDCRCHMEKLNYNESFTDFSSFSKHSDMDQYTPIFLWHSILNVKMANSCVLGMKTTIKHCQFVDVRARNK